MDEAILEFLKAVGDKSGNFSPPDSQLFNDFILKRLQIDKVFGRKRENGTLLPSYTHTDKGKDHYVTTVLFPDMTVLCFDPNGCNKPERFKNAIMLNQTNLHKEKIVKGKVNAVYGVLQLWWK